MWVVPVPRLPQEELPMEAPSVETYLRQPPVEGPRAEALVHQGLPSPCRATSAQGVHLPPVTQAPLPVQRPIARQERRPPGHHLPQLQEPGGTLPEP